MKSIESILVVMDSRSEDQAALIQAVKIATKTKARLELFLVVYNSQFVSHWGFNQEQLDALKKEYLASKLRWLKTYAAEVEAIDIIVNIEVVWHSDASCAILAKIADNTSMVIKSVNQDSLITKMLFTPSDWQLLEHCKVPLLLTKNITNNSYNKIMAAVKPDKNHVNAKQLDANILAESMKMAELFNGEPHVCHCYEPIGIELWQGMSSMGIDGSVNGDFNEYNDEINKHHETVFNKLISEYSLDEKSTHLVAGAAVDEIPALVKKEKVGLLVMGMSNNGKFIGNTIEKILDNIECDVLSIQCPQE